MKIFLAKALCWLAHFGQKRKYTGEPYYSHPFQVARLVETVGGDKYDIMAAVLHDTVEDTWVPFWLIEFIFGPVVRKLVWEVTDEKPYLGGPNRATRKANTIKRLSMASSAGQTIKLADLISNTYTIVENDPDFAKVYMKEKEELLQVLQRGSPTLYEMARNIIDAYNKGIKYRNSAMDYIQYAQKQKGWVV